MKTRTWEDFGIDLSDLPSDGRPWVLAEYQYVYKKDPTKKLKKPRRIIREVGHFHGTAEQWIHTLPTKEQRQFFATDLAYSLWVNGKARGIDLLDDNTWRLRSDDELRRLFEALHQRRGQAPSTGSFSDRFLNNSPSISAAQYAHPQAVIFEVAEAIRSPLNQLHFSMETFCNAVIPSKTEHSGHFFPPIMQRLAQCAQRREGCFSKLIDFIQ